MRQPRRIAESVTGSTSILERTYIMKFLHSLVLASTAALTGATAWAAQPAAQANPAPTQTTPANATPDSATGAATAGDNSQRMDAQIAAMRQMHQKMMDAKTPEARQALMAEHMKTMQDGMAMMSGMSGMAGMGGMGGAGKGGMAGMGSMGGAGKGGMNGKMPSDMAAHHQMMAKRMEMMETMMQMMMDRLPATPAK
jgi:hypothetical protein